MNRRNLFRALGMVTGALIVPPSVTASAEEARRIWALGAMPRKEPIEASFTDMLHDVAVAVKAVPITIDYDELIHLTRELHENYYPVGHPDHATWQTMILIPRELEQRPR